MKTQPYILALALAASAAQPFPTAARSEILHSDTCGECHKTIYKMWRNSAHARAMENDVFLEAYRETQGREGKQVGQICLGCHAPLTQVNKDWKLERKVTWEGVNCDVCHSLVSVDLSGSAPVHRFDVGKVKRGPIQDAVSAGHDVLYSELHTSSLACAGCHEFTNAEGTPLMTTYTEWVDSGSAKAGQTCQHCHMATVKGDVVDPRIARVDHAEVNLHEMPGGHSLDQLHKALRIVMEPRRGGDSLHVRIRLINKGAGHAVPTGMPGRRIILDLQVWPYGGEPMFARKVYGKFFLDANGERITRDSRYFASGVRLESDSRILQDETRTEDFAFAVPKASTASAKLKMIYEHSPRGDEAEGTRFVFYSESRTLLPEGAPNQ